MLGRLQGLPIDAERNLLLFRLFLRLSRCEIGQWRGEQAPRQGQANATGTIDR